MHTHLSGSRAYMVSLCSGAFLWPLRFSPPVHVQIVHRVWLCPVVGWHLIQGVPCLVSRVLHVTLCRTSRYAIWKNGWIDGIFLPLSLSLRNTPDHMQESQGEGYTKDWLKLLSAVCVRAPGYGTRLANYCVYLERLVKVFWTVALSKSIYFAFLSHSGSGRTPSSWSTAKITSASPSAPCWTATSPSGAHGPSSSSCRNERTTPAATRAFIHHFHWTLTLRWSEGFLPASVCVEFHKTLKCEDPRGTVTWLNLNTTSVVVLNVALNVVFGPFFKNNYYRSVLV